LGCVNAAATTLGEVLTRATDFLAAGGCETPRLDAELLLARALELERIDLYMQLDRPLTETELAQARRLVRRRADREPVQYILGEWGFRRLTLTVDRRALIPRPETEVVVERCLELLDGLAAPRVLDVGTGSGAIALALVDEHPGAQVTGIDASAEALTLARENAMRTGLEIALLRHDLLAGLPGGPWDLVVSNPPYVLSAELAGLSPEVRDWEPQAALVEAGATEAVARSAGAVLEDGGSLVLEVADGTAESVAALLGGLGFHSIRVTQDLAGRPRVVEGTANGSRAGAGGSRGLR
jgi:release factor glutamine methyltransferase